MSSGLLFSVSLRPSLVHSFLYISSSGLHGPMRPLLLHRRKDDSATQLNSWFKNHIFERTPKQPPFLPLLLLPPSCVCLPKMWHNASLKLQETNEIPLCWHDWPVCRTCRGMGGLYIFFERFCGVDLNILTRAHDESTQGDMKRKKVSTLLEYACFPSSSSSSSLPPFLLCIVYSSSLRLTSWCLNYVTMVAFSGSDWPVVQ